MHTLSRVCMLRSLLDDFTHLRVSFSKVPLSFPGNASQATSQNRPLLGTETAYLIAPVP